MQPNTEPKKKKYRYDLRKLEDDGIDALKAYYADDNEQTKTNLFKAIKALAYAVLDVGNFAKYNIDFEEISYEYALYLFERIIIGTFRPFDKAIDRFPFQKYVDRNIYHIVVTKRPDSYWHDLINDLEFLVDTDSGEMSITPPQEEKYNEKMDKSYITNRIYRTMRMFYNEQDVKRMFPLALDIINQDKILLVQEDDMREFVQVLIAAAKRVTTDYNVNQNFFTATPGSIKKARSACVRSTMFLSSIVNTKFMPKELLLSLDIDSLYRLVQLNGGKTIRVPTQQELDTLVGATVAASKVILEGQEIEESLWKGKCDYNLVFTKHINTTNFVSKILESYSIYGDSKESEPLINVLLISIKSLTKLLEEIKDSKINNPHLLIEQYKEVSNTFNQLTEGLLSISGGNNDPK